MRDRKQNFELKIKRCNERIANAEHTANHAPTISGQEIGNQRLQEERKLLSELQESLAKHERENPDSLIKKPKKSMTDKQRLKNHELAIVKIVASIERMAHVVTPLLPPDLEKQWYKAMQHNNEIIETLKRES